MKRTSFLAMLLLVSSMTQSVWANVISSDLCVKTLLGANVGIDSSVTTSMDFEAGAAWQIGFVGELVVVGDIVLNNTGTSFGRGHELSAVICVDSVQLYHQLEADLLTDSQAAAARDYFGSLEFQPYKQAEIRTALLNEAAIRGLNPSGVEAAFRPLGSTLDSLVRMAGGELSALDALDESVFVLKGLADALPVPAKLKAYIKDFDNAVASNANAISNDPLNTLCPPNRTNYGQTSSALDDFCAELETVRESGELVKQQLMDVQNFSEDIYGELRKITKTVRKVSTTVKGVERKAKNLVDDSDSVISSLVGAVQRIFAVGSSAENLLNGFKQTATQMVSDITQGFNEIKGTVENVFNRLLGKEGEDGEEDIIGLRAILGTLTSPLEAIKSFFDIFN